MTAGMRLKSSPTSISTNLRYDSLTLMKTEAAVLREIGKPLSLEELEIPELQRGQVLVKILYSGVCGRQYNEWKGYYGEDKFLPHTFGHEGSAIVEKVGQDVETVKPGDYVVLTWIKGKGIDAAPCKYKNNKGETINSGQISAFSNYAVVSENRMVKVPKELPPDIAAPLGCAIPTGVGIVKNTLKAGKGSSIAIFGVGGIGQCAVIGARLAGCKKIIAVDIYDNKLELAKEFGATHIINSKKENPVSKIKELTDGKGTDFAVEATGVAKAMEQAYESVKAPGRVALTGNPRKGETITIDPYGLIYGKELMGTKIGETYRNEEIHEYAKMCINGELKLDKLITSKYGLSDINKAFDDLEKGKIARALVKF